MNIDICTHRLARNTDLLVQSVLPPSSLLFHLFVHFSPALFTNLLLNHEAPVLGGAQTHFDLRTCNLFLGKTHGKAMAVFRKSGDFGDGTLQFFGDCVIR